MLKNQNTPCGCRCNSANDTREVAASNLAAAPLLDVAQRSLVYDAGREQREHLSKLVSDLERKVARAISEHSFGSDFVLDGGPHLVFQFHVRGHDNAEPFPDCLNLVKLGAFEGHVSSPVVAESEAATSDAPAMTVQEGGSSDAAPGVEGASPASSTPRFVVVGQYVYDRELNRTADFGHATSARFALEQINAGNDLDDFYWEAAK